MQEREILNKIAGLKHLEPQKDFAAVSRKLITYGDHEPSLSPELNSAFSAFKKIVPDANYALQSKLTILESPVRKTILQILSEKYTSIKTGHYALALGLTTFLIVAMAGLTSYLRSPIPTLSDGDLIKEAGRIANDIDIHLETIDYYALTAAQSDIALNEVWMSNANHINSRILEQEASRTDRGAAERNHEVDRLLDQATF